MIPNQGFDPGLWPIRQPDSHGKTTMLNVHGWSFYLQRLDAVHGGRPDCGGSITKPEGAGHIPSATTARSRLPAPLTRRIPLPIILPCSRPARGGNTSLSRFVFRLCGNP